LWRTLLLIPQKGFYECLPAGTYWFEFNYTGSNFNYPQFSENSIVKQVYGCTPQIGGQLAVPPCQNGGGGGGNSPGPIQNIISATSNLTIIPTPPSSKAINANIQYNNAAISLMSSVFNYAPYTLTNGREIDVPIIVILSTSFRNE
jgi:hypothetical protein